MKEDLAFLEQVTPELLARHDRPGPRYTSYPTAVEFTRDFGSDELLSRLEAASARPEQPLSLYLHVPFCERRCSFCGCNVIITRKQEKADDYIEHLGRELEIIARRLGNRRRVVQYHWGGGTPTFLDESRMERLQEKVLRCFDIDENAEAAIEVDPDVTSVSQLEKARELGFNRLSIGVQDLDEKVLESVRRTQSAPKTRELLEAARELGFASVNFDLIYGLPHQRPETFDRTLEIVLEMRPDRLAVYSFAYVPWIRGNQRRIDESTLPDRETKFALFALAVRRFLAAGYAQIGMDHFAVPEDELARAVEQRRLFRNFMGYTVHRATEMIGAGVSSISSVEGAFAQNLKKPLSDYYRAIEEGILPVERGRALDEDDRIRGRTITELMCNFCVRFDELSRELGIDFSEYFAPELELLAGEDGPVHRELVRLDGESLRVTPLGRLFVRNVAMVFDRYLAAKSKGDGPVFSRTV
jgi:oxygen-independent coproporphyrinogen III oxidase